MFSAISSFCLRIDMYISAAPELLQATNLSPVAQSWPPVFGNWTILEPPRAFLRGAIWLDARVIRRSSMTISVLRNSPR